MFLNRFKIGTRLRVGFSILVLMMLIMSAVGIINMVKIQNKLDHIVKVGAEETRLAYSMVGLIHRNQVLIRNILLETDPEAMKADRDKLKASSKKVDEVEERLSELLSLPGTTEEEKAVFSQIRESENAIQPVANHALELALSGRKDEAAKILLENLRAP